MLRESPIAGDWYPGTEEELKELIQKKLKFDKFGPQLDTIETKSRYPTKQLIGVISPHAGYRYSGGVAAHSYTNLKREYSELDTVIILGPLHRALNNAVAIYPEGLWETPMGEIAIKKELLEYCRDYDFDSISEIVSFDPSYHQFEHSIEMQIPFLQYLYDEITVLPIGISKQDYQTAEILATLIYSIKNKFGDNRIAVIASTDLSHSENYSQLERDDKRIKNLVEAGDSFGLNRIRKNGRSFSMCGVGPVLTILKLAELYEGRKTIIETYKYANSAETADTRGSYTVGYYAAGVYV